MALTLNSSTRVLFIGDSITDCGWQEDPEKIGSGYVRLIRDFLLAKAPAAAPKVFNRGISGNKIPDLQNRWQRDVLDLAPDILSIYIGINDVWHGLAFDRQGCDIDSYRAGYEDILRQTKRAIPKITLVLCEPSVLWLKDHPGANDKLIPYVRAVHQLADEFDATAVVGLHEAFENARLARPEIAWTSDGVHPTSIGHMLIARTWLSAAGIAMDRF